MNPQTQPSYPSRPCRFSLDFVRGLCRWASEGIDMYAHPPRACSSFYPGHVQASTVHLTWACPCPHSSYTLGMFKLLPQACSCPHSSSTLGMFKLPPWACSSIHPGHVQASTLGMFKLLPQACSCPHSSSTLGMFMRPQFI